MAELLARFYSPNSGTIHFGGKEISSFSRTSFLPKVALVSQDAPLFSGSFVENISYGANISMKDTQLKEAALGIFVMLHSYSNVLHRFEVHHSPSVSVKFALFQYF